MKDSVVANLFYYIVLAVFPFVYPFMLGYEVVSKLTRGENFAIAMTKLIAIPCVSLIAASYFGIGVGIGAFYGLSYSVVNLEKILPLQKK